MATFVETAAAAGKPERFDDITLAAADTALVKSLAAYEPRRIKLALTFVGGHVYIDRDGVTIDGAITSGSVS